MVGGMPSQTERRVSNVQVCQETIDHLIDSNSDSPQARTSIGKRSQNQKARSRLEAISCDCNVAITERCHDYGDDEDHGWQQHSVRGFLAGVVRKRLKLKLDSKRVDGERVYRVAAAR